MIIRRENYSELSWWKWTRLRGILAWARFTGGFARSLRLENTGVMQASSQHNSQTSNASCPKCGSISHCEISLTEDN